MSESVIAALLFACAILVAMILALATGAKKLQRISGYILAPAGLVGLFFYTAAYIGSAQGFWGGVGAAFHAVYTTCLMFMGRNDYSGALKGAPWLFEHGALQAVFWLVHLAALFVSASALLSTLGKKLLQALRVRLLHRENLYVIFGLSEQSVYLGRDLCRDQANTVAFISPKNDPALIEQVIAMGAIFRQEPYLLGDAVNGRLLRALGVKRGSKVKRCFFLMLDEGETVNIQLTGRLIAYLKAEGVETGRVRLFLRSHGELDYSQLAQFEQGGERYDVDAFSDAELAARLLILQTPPYKTMEFDAQGKAKSDFHALIIGFGQVGQHTLRQVVMNGQFYGSRFKATVVDRDIEQTSGQFERRYKGMTENFDLEFKPLDIRSKAFYDLLDSLAHQLKYIVVCLGDDDMNYEATADLERYFTRFPESDRPSILVSVIDKRYVAQTQKNIRFFDRRQQVFCGDILLRDGIDKMAVAVNWSYNQRLRDASDAFRVWEDTGYFSRESCRASADFIPAMLAIAGLSEAEASDATRFAERVREGSELLENLSITEHLRWNAFHFAMGYTKMEPKEVKARAEAGLSAIQKDLRSLKHACLVTWDELDDVSALVGGLKGDEALDYKEYDRVNVRMIPRTLAYMEEL